jgi:hypothetical protein
METAAAAFPAVARQGMRLSAFSRAYVAAGLVLVGVMLYLFLSAQVTQSTYEITSLKRSQAELQAQQDQLRYEQARLTSPSTVDAGAATSGLVRANATGYLDPQPIAIDLGAEIGPSPADQGPLWQRVMAAFLETLTGREAIATTP